MSSAPGAGVGQRLLRGTEVGEVTMEGPLGGDGGASWMR